MPFGNILAMDREAIDMLTLQTGRVERSVGELLPDGVADFNPDKLPAFISFVVRDRRNRNYFIIPFSGDYTPAELEGWTDARLLKAIEALCGPRMPRTD